ncbi:MAG: ATP-binding cassette domain-containing protein [Flavonifractor plautii]
MVQVRKRAAGCGKRVEPYGEARKFLALLGGNGTGKTTSLKLLSGLRSLTGGR